MAGRVAVRSRGQNAAGNIGFHGTVGGAGELRIHDSMSGVVSPAGRRG